MSAALESAQDSVPGPRDQSVHPFFFGPPIRTLFGWLHLPRDTWSGARVVICPPLGYEGLFAHPALRYLALRLTAASRAAVLRLDYDGTGDSAGCDTDPDRVAAWIASVDYAIDHLKELAPSDGPIVLVGLRAGALLATYAALERTDVDVSIMWAPVIRGRAFVREQRAFAKMAHATAASAETSMVDWGPGGFEANGYAFTGSTVTGLNELDLGSCPSPGAKRVLVLERDDVPGDAAKLGHWQDVAAVDVEVAPGYLGMMDPPISMSLPTQAADRVCSFVAGLSAGSYPAPEELPVRSSGKVADNVVERCVWYDDGNLLFGILTLPADASPTTGLILLNNAKGNRTGPHGMNVGLARRLADEGVATLRLDLAGIGDSFLPAGRPDHHVYALDALEDVQSAASFLRRTGIERIAVGGLCSAAYLGWHAAKQIEGIASAIMVNLQLFEWDDMRSLSVSPLQTQYESDYYAQAMKRPEKWKKLLAGQVNVAEAAAVMGARLWHEAVARTHDLRASLRLIPPTAAVRDVRALSERGVRLRFIFSGRDPGYAALKSELGSEMKSLLRDRQIQVDLVEGPDHSFTPRWASEKLIDLFVDELVALATE